MTNNSKTFSMMALSMAALGLVACGNPIPEEEGGLSTTITHVKCFDINGAPVLTNSSENYEGQRYSSSVSNGVLSVKVDGDHVAQVSGSSCVRAEYNVAPETIDSTPLSEDTMTYVATNGFNQILGSVEGENLSVNSDTGEATIRLLNENGMPLVVYKFTGVSLVGFDDEAQLGQGLREVMPQVRQTPATALAQ